MFTWICPECGREVPPHFTECPDCAERKLKAGAGAVPETAAAPPGTPVQPEPPRAVPRAAVPAQQVVPGGRVPAWAVTLVVAAVLIGLGALFFYYLPSKRGDATPQAALEQPGAAAHPFAKYIEVTGFRITEDEKQRARIRFTVVNHSGAEIADLTGNVVLKPVTAKPEDAPMASFTFKIKSLPPYQVKDMEEDVKMKLRAYELPDWQFLRADTRISAP